MIIPEKNGTRRHVGRAPRSTLLPMTATLLVLLVLTLWFTSFKKLRITITKPADTDPPFLIRRNQPIEIEGIADFGGNIYQQPEMIQIKCFSKDPNSAGGERVHWNTSLSIDRVTKRFREKIQPPPTVAEDNAYITTSWALERPGSVFDRIHRNLVSNVVRLRVE